jgi:hypothetical protein
MFETAQEALRQRFCHRSNEQILEQMKSILKTHGRLSTALLSCLSWKWRKRSSVKIAERTYEERAQALHC